METTEDLFFVLQTSPLKLKPCTSKAGYLCLRVCKERGRWFACCGEGGCCSLLPAIATSSCVFYYISLETTVIYNFAFHKNGSKSHLYE